MKFGDLVRTCTPSTDVVVHFDGNYIKLHAIRFVALLDLEQLSDFNIDFMQVNANKIHVYVGRE